MIRFNLGAQGLGRVRFAMSQVGVANDLLFALGRYPRLLGARWQAKAVQALSERHLGLLAAVGGGGPLGYSPDFLRPEPTGFQASLESTLHQIATTPAERVRYELSSALDGHSWDRTTAHRPPRLLLAAMERGEEYLAQRVAVELEQFWHAALAPRWPGIRARMEAEIAARASAIALHGIAHTVNQLAPNVSLDDDSVLGIHLLASHALRLSVDADSAILVPSVFSGRAIVCAAEPADVPVPRTPLIIYPAAPNDCRPGSGGDELLGATRAKLLAELSQPHTTGELATRLSLSPATVSYHLQILHRAGLVQRTRRSRTVLYQRLTAKPGLAGALG
ncbi:ArsR/SmtB family transcription factor [Kitasatospora sp. NPDC094028]